MIVILKGNPIAQVQCSFQSAYFCVLYSNLQIPCFQFPVSSLVSQQCSITGALCQYDGFKFQSFQPLGFQNLAESSLQRSVVRAQFWYVHVVPFCYTSGVLLSNQQTHSNKDMCSFLYLLVLVITSFFHVSFLLCVPLTCFNPLSLMPVAYLLFYHQMVLTYFWYLSNT